jgi:hypothetical protein
MTVSGTGYLVSITGDGGTPTISVTYPFLGTGSSAELTVVERTIATGAEETKVYTTDYTVTGGSGSTGSVIAAGAVASTVEWHVRRNTTTTQTSDYVTNDPFAADTIEDNLDRLTMAGQERDGDISQAFKYPDTYTGSGTTVMPEPTADAYLKWNAGGTALENTTTATGQYLGGDGTVSLPFYSYSADPDTGFYRIGTGNIAYSANGSKVLDMLTTGLSVTGTLSASGTITATGTLAASGALTVATTAAITGVTTHGGNVVSDTDSTDDLGTTGVRWANLYVDDITATTAITAGGLITGGSATLATGATVTGFNTSTALGASDTLVPTQNAVKTYVDALVSANNSNWKADVVNATTANITLSGEQTIDGVLTSTSRILVKDQSSTSQNGIYVTAAGAWARAADMDAWTEFPQAYVPVQQGTANKDTSWLCIADDGGTVGSTAVVFSQFGLGGGGGGWLGESGAPNGDSSDIIRINEQTLNTSNTIVATDNASATGPLSIASGVTITVSSGATFVVI